MRLYNALILPNVCGRDMTLKAEDTRRLEAFEMRCLRAILGVTRRDRLRNELLRKTLNVPNTITSPPESHVNRPTAKTSQTQDHEEDHQRGGSTKYLKTQGYL